MSRQRPESTDAGKALFALVAVAAVGVALWIAVYLPEWLAHVRLGKAGSLLVLVAAAIGLIVLFLGAALTYAILALLLEGLGVQLNRPMSTGAEAAGLTPGEEGSAAAATVHVVWYVYVQEDATGTDVTWGVPVAIHASAPAAEADRAARPDPPPGEFGPDGTYVVDQPCNLAALFRTGIADAQALHAFLRGGGAVELRPKQWYSPGYYAQYLRSVPLSAEESRRAEAIQVWTVYYEDRFHIGPSREAFPVAVCLSAEEAHAEVARRGPMVSGFDGHLAGGPSPLVRPGERAPELGADVVRELIRRAEAGQGGPVPVF